MICYIRGDAKKSPFELVVGLTAEMMDENRVIGLRRFKKKQSQFFVCVTSLRFHKQRVRICHSERSESDQ